VKGYNFVVSLATFADPDEAIAVIKAKLAQSGLLAVRCDALAALQESLRRQSLH